MIRPLLVVAEPTSWKADRFEPESEKQSVARAQHQRVGHEDELVDEVG